VEYSTLWSEDFKVYVLQKGLKQWLKKGRVKHDASHVHKLKDVRVPSAAKKEGERFAKGLLKHKAIMGVFDEGCMGMYNAIIPDELLHKTGVFKERLSQSTLYAAMLEVTDAEATSGLPMVRQKRHAVSIWHERADRAHPKAGSSAVQDVHCHRADRR
jgi:hypothetical protein